MKRFLLESGCLLALTLPVVIFVSVIYISGNVHRFLPVDAWYELIIENRSKDTVVVLVDYAYLPNWEDENIEGCSTKSLGRIWFGPGQVVEVEVRDTDGLTVLTTEASPKLREGSSVKVEVSHIDGLGMLTTEDSLKLQEGNSADGYLEVVVPGVTDDECQ